MKKLLIILCIWGSVCCLDVTGYAEVFKETQGPIGAYYFRYEEGPPYHYQLQYSENGVDYQNVNVPSTRMPGSWPVYGNNRYIFAEGYAPEEMERMYKAELDNGPLYVFDANLNLIDKVDYGGYLDSYPFSNGRFWLNFLYKEDPATSKLYSYSSCNVIYSTVDGVNWSFVSVNKVDNTFDFEGQSLIKIVDKPKHLYLNENAPNPYLCPEKVGNYYFKTINGELYYSEDCVTLIPMNKHAEIAKGVCDGEYYIASATGVSYLYDAELNLLGTTKWNGYEPNIFIRYKGTFYAKEYIADFEDHSSYTVYYYRSHDGLNWEPISEEAYAIASETEVLVTGDEYRTVIGSHGKKCYLNGIEVLYDESVADHRADDPSVAYRKSLMYDGLKKIYLPLNANLKTGVRNDGNYVYVSIDVLDSKCYCIPLEAFKSEVKVLYDGKYLGFDTAPVIENDRALIPLRFLFEQMGATVNWNEELETATIEHEGRSIVISIDDTIALVDGKAKKMDVPARLINNRTMIPLRFIAEGLGYTVNWDENSRTAEIK